MLTVPRCSYNRVPVNERHSERRIHRPVIASIDWDDCHKPTACGTENRHPSEPPNRTYASLSGWSIGTGRT
jgi:hypothetical protein